MDNKERIYNIISNIGANRDLEETRELVHYSLAQNILTALEGKKVDLASAIFSDGNVQESVLNMPLKRAGKVVWRGLGFGGRKAKAAKKATHLDHLGNSPTYAHNSGITNPDTISRAKRYAPRFERVAKGKAPFPGPKTIKRERISTGIKVGLGAAGGAYVGKKVYDEVKPRHRRTKEEMQHQEEGGHNEGKE